MNTLFLTILLAADPAPPVLLKPARVFDGVEPKAHQGGRPRPRAIGRKITVFGVRAVEWERRSRGK